MLKAVYTAHWSIVEDARDEEQHMELRDFLQIHCGVGIDSEIGVLRVDDDTVDSLTDFQDDWAARKVLNKVVQAYREKFYFLIVEL